jgi:hypothetical protein
VRTCKTVNETQQNPNDKCVREKWRDESTKMAMNALGGRRNTQRRILISDAIKPRTCSLSCELDALWRVLDVALLIGRDSMTQSMEVEFLDLLKFSPDR